MNKKTGSCLDIGGGADENGDPVQQYIDNGNPAQRFALIRQDFAITYNANGGSGAPAAQTKWRDVSLVLSNTKPIRSGYNFLGWSTSSTATSATYAAGASYTANAAATLYAVWKMDLPQITYTVTYDFAENGGTSATKTTATLADNATVDLTPTASKRIGWTFVGWNTDPDATTALSALTINGDSVTLYAIYKASVAGTFIDSAGRRIVNATIYNKATSTTITPPAPRAYGGGVSLGWSVETTPSAGIVNAFVAEETGIAYYAQYSGNNIILEYNTGGGTSVDTQIGEWRINSFNLSAPLLPEFVIADAPTKEGYTFVTWQTVTGDPIAPGDRITTGVYNQTLYAIWREIPPATYLVNYNSNGGYDAPMAQTKTEGQPLKLSDAVPSKYGYTFLGWSDQENASNVKYQAGTNYVVDASVTLYAVWKANTYSIKYNANGGSGSMANSSHTYDTAKVLSANAYSKTGYTFAGWAYAPDGEVVFGNGESITNLTIQNGAVVELYAVWLAIPPATYSVTATNGSGGGNFAVGTEVTVTASVPTGQQFARWNISPAVTFTSGTGANNATAKFTMPAGAVTATAVFEPIPTTVPTTTRPSTSPTTTIPTTTAPTATTTATTPTSATTMTTTNSSPTEPPNPPTTAPIKYIFSTKYKATLINWILFFVCFGWIWMWF